MKKIKKVRKQKKVRKVHAPIRQELTIRVQPIAAPTVKDLAPIETTGGKYMIPKTWMSEKQVVRLVQGTPKQHIYTRPAKGGGTWSYVTGHYVEKVLNFTFGWNWDFEVVNHGKEGDMVWVLGKLTVKDDHGHTIIKSQFGRADIKMKKSGGMLDYGNDLKSATTDALKKCASLLGIASDIYGKSEIKAETGQEVREALPAPKNAPQAQNEPIPAMKEGQVEGPDGRPTYVCSKCGDPIVQAVADYSKRLFGNRLCKDCQPKK